MPALFLRQTLDDVAAPEREVDLAATRENSPAKALVFKLQRHIAAGWVVVRNQSKLIELVKTYPDGTVKRRIFEVR